MDKKFKGKIISSLRKLSFTWKPKTAVKNAQKVFPATYECVLCGLYVYEGSSDKNYQKALDELKRPIERSKIHIDHIDPVIPLEGFKRGSWDWDDFINRLFVEEAGMQCICAKCHDVKTRAESEERVKWRKKNKQTNTSKD